MGRKYRALLTRKYNVTEVAHMQDDLHVCFHTAGQGAPDHTRSQHLRYFNFSFSSQLVDDVVRR